MEQQGLVVQSIVSLTTSLSRQFVKYMLTILSNPLLFLLKKCENLLQCKKILTFFPTKIAVYLYYYDHNVLSFNETLTNDIVNFEQPAPDMETQSYCGSTELIRTHL